MQWRQSRQNHGLRARAKEDDPLEGYRERNPLLINGFATVYTFLLTNSQNALAIYSFAVKMH